MKPTRNKDLMQKMLVFDPSGRTQAGKALEHEYLRALHNVNDEVGAFERLLTAAMHAVRRQIGTPDWALVAA